MLCLYQSLPDGQNVILQSRALSECGYIQRFIERDQQQKLGILG